MVDSPGLEPGKPTWSRCFTDTGNCRYANHPLKIGFDCEHGGQSTPVEFSTLTVIQQTCRTAESTSYISAISGESLLSTRRALSSPHRPCPGNVVLNPATPGRKLVRKDGVEPSASALSEQRSADELLPYRKLVDHTRLELVSPRCKRGIIPLY